MISPSVTPDPAPSALWRRSNVGRFSSAHCASVDVSLQPQLKKSESSEYFSSMGEVDGELLVSKFVFKIGERGCGRGRRGRRGRGGGNGGRESTHKERYPHSE